MNRLLFGQININSIRKKFELLFSPVSNNIDVLLISETKIKNKFPVSQFVYMVTQCHLDLTVHGMKEVLYYVFTLLYVIMLYGIMLHFVEC